MLGKWDFVNVGLDGTFSGDGRIHTTPADVDALLAKLREDKPKQLLLLFHGGLVGEARAIDGINQIHARLARDGVRPIYFVWETGMPEIVEDILDEMSGGWFSKIVEQVSRLVAKRVIGGEARAALTVDVVRSELRKLEPFAELESNTRSAVSFDEGLSQELEVEAQSVVGQDARTQPEVLLSVPPEVERHLREKNVDEATVRAGGWWWLVKAVASIAFRCVSRHAKGRDHGIYPTIVEEVLRETGIATVGRRIWSEMKERAMEMWLPNEGRSEMKQHAGRYFLEGLAKLRKDNPAWNVSIDLAGHSAGSIAVCHLLETVVDMGVDLPFRNIVLHAPACTTRLFVEQVVRRAKSEKPPYKSVRVFTMTDAQERADTFGGLLYPRSLLYFISGVLEKDADAPILGLARHIYGLAPVADDELKPFFADPHGRERLVLSPTKLGASAGYISAATSHAGFAFDESTLSSLVHLCQPQVE